jgi:hypothetical protein
MDDADDVGWLETKLSCYVAGADALTVHFPHAPGLGSTWPVLRNILEIGIMVILDIAVPAYNAVFLKWWPLQTISRISCRAGARFPYGLSRNGQWFRERLEKRGSNKAAEMARYYFPVARETADSTASPGFVEDTQPDQSANTARLLQNTEDVFSSWTKPLTR